MAVKSASMRKTKPAKHWRGKMSSRYDVIRPDTLEEMRRAGHIAKLEARIEQLEAATDDLAQYVSRADWHYLKDETRKALEGKDG